ncbi:MAG: hypothetical protein AAF490_30755 [Chloroflexota bacterium]
MTDKLIIIEQAEALFVTYNGDIEDWIARFDLSENPQFPARQWAERMVSLYNLEFETEEQTT